MFGLHVIWLPPHPTSFPFSHGRCRPAPYAANWLPRVMKRLSWERLPKLIQRSHHVGLGFGTILLPYMWAMCCSALRAFDPVRLVACSPADLAWVGQPFKKRPRVLDRHS